MSKIGPKGRVLILVVAASLLLLAGVAGPGAAQSAWPYDLSWNTVDGGGGTFSTGGPYRLGGTIGQADAGVMIGTGYGLAGGFWGRGWAPFEAYLPLVVRN